MGARENKCQISQNGILHMKFSEFYLCFHNSREIWHLFSRVWPLKNVEKNAIIFKIILAQGFFPPKIKITLFSDGFRLKKNINIVLFCFNFKLKATQIAIRHMHIYQQFLMSLVITS